MELVWHQSAPPPGGLAELASPDFTSRQGYLGSAPDGFDAGFAGLVITLGPAFATVDIGPDGVVSAGAATQLPVLARQTAAAGFTGLEWAVHRGHEAPE